ncbi:helix-turn-helix transcriptional regulator [Oceanobacillus alkalisoli]|uniref:helix-turn-helix transcriptional regulator n=1 Tax=Oceanobacillus alkalisoli TaxID=2925113 RepID=UPI001EEFC54D|nr:helix-turn-helix transcriptional regulator [Oceanobacillus alkalisoli]MCF3942166.1 helix-turn-helix transcriptional regulator [Oceanobacillus alkalisoli]MCG5104398.1 helix-turn-helix transcriptional regulator [Oceanobacillus alkalisoli]
MTVLHNRIKQLRKERDVNQQKLADYLGIERTSLSKIENMEYNPSAKTILKVCEFFDLSIGDIFFNKSVSINDTKEVV